METIKAIWKWLNDNGAVVGILVALVPLAWSGISFLRQKKKELMQLQFETYHRLIDELVRGKGGALFIDSQIAIVFELRRFPAYFPVTRRVLRHLRAGWVANPINQRLVEEIDITLAHIHRKIGKGEK